MQHVRNQTRPFVPWKAGTRCAHFLGWRYAASIIIIKVEHWRVWNKLKKTSRRTTLFNVVNDTSCNEIWHIVLYARIAG